MHPHLLRATVLITIAFGLPTAGCISNQADAIASPYNGRWIVELPELQRNACITVFEGAIVEWVEECSGKRLDIHRSLAAVHAPGRVTWSYELGEPSAPLLVALDVTDQGDVLAGSLTIVELATTRAEMYSVRLRRR